MLASTRPHFDTPPRQNAPTTAGVTASPAFGISDPDCAQVPVSGHDFPQSEAFGGGRWSKLFLDKISISVQKSGQKGTQSHY